MTIHLPVSRNILTEIPKRPMGKPANGAETVNYLENYCPDWTPPLTPFNRGTGARKCEANALVVRPKAARKLCLKTILKFLSPHDPQRYRSMLKGPREELRKEIMTYRWKRATHDRAGRYWIRPVPNSTRDWS
jgi:hypothetical protein